MRLTLYFPFSIDEKKFQNEIKISRLRHYPTEAKKQFGTFKNSLEVTEYRYRTFLFYFYFIIFFSLL